MCSSLPTATCRTSTWLPRAPSPPHPLTATPTHSNTNTHKHKHTHQVVYNAGTDVLAGDPLGRLGVSHAGVVERDELVGARARGVCVRCTCVCDCDIV